MRAWAVALAVLLLASCADGSTGGTPPTSAAGPEQAVESFFRAFEAGDCAAARDVVLAPDDLDCTVVAESAGALADAGIDLDTATFTAGDVIDDSATVEIAWGTGDAEVVDVQRVEGSWVVVLDSAA